MNVCVLLIHNILKIKGLIYVALGLCGRVLRLRCVDLQQIYVNFYSCGSVLRSEESIQFMFPFIVTEAAHLEPGYRSAVQENALVVSLQMFNLILEKCVSLLREQLERPTEAQSSRLLVSEDLQVLLPAVKVSGIVYFLASLQNCEKRLLASSLRRANPSSRKVLPSVCVCVCVCVCVS